MDAPADVLIAALSWMATCWVTVSHNLVASSTVHLLLVGHFDTPALALRYLNNKTII